jgi:hypothetical protein
MDKETRNRIERATQAARGLLEQDFADQLEGVFDIRLDGTLALTINHIFAGRLRRPGLDTGRRSW